MLLIQVYRFPLTLTSLSSWFYLHKCSWPAWGIVLNSARSSMFYEIDGKLYLFPHPTPQKGWKNGALILAFAQPHT